MTLSAALLPHSREN